MKNRLNLLMYFLKKDIKARYAGSGLGLLWSIFTPLVQIVLFWFVFSGIMKARPYATTQMPYIYFLLSSFFFWLAFSDGITRSSNIIIENAEIVKKISFPNIILPVTVTITSYLLNVIGFLFFMIAYTTTTTFSPIIVLVIPVLFFQLLFSLGLGMFLAALLPYIRDLGQIVGHILQGMFFVSPILYSIDSVPEKLRIIFYFNPITYFISSYHRILLLKEIPSLFFIWIIFCISITSFFGGFYTFKKLRDGFADVL